MSCKKFRTSNKGTLGSHTYMVTNIYNKYIMPKTIKAMSFRKTDSKHLGRYIFSKTVLHNKDESLMKTITYKHLFEPLVFVTLSAQRFKFNFLPTDAPPALHIDRQRRIIDDNYPCMNCNQVITVCAGSRFALPQEKFHLTLFIRAAIISMKRYL